MEIEMCRSINGMVGWPFLTYVWWVISQPWSPLLLLAATLVWVYQYGRWRWLLVGLMAVAITDPLVAQVLKPIFARPRPCVDLYWLVTPYGCGSGFSLPSGHAATTFALAAAIGAPWFWALAVVVALSRVVIGVHYPTDVVAGAAVGILVGMICRRVGERLHAWWSVNKLREQRRGSV